MRRLGWWIGGAAGLALLYASWAGWAPPGLTPFSVTEALGFVTGALCVYLVVRENVWNFPVGIANSAFFLILFAGARLLGVAAFVVAGTAALTLFFRYVNDSAPFLDAFTTALSLGAQYLLNRKAVENWWLWMTADVVYIYLYAARGLHLTAVLYLVFLCLCVAGLRSWLRTMSARGSETGNGGAPVLEAGGGAV